MVLLKKKEKKWPAVLWNRESGVASVCGRHARHGEDERCGAFHRRRTGNDSENTATGDSESGATCLSATEFGAIS
jgi:hypothetical protein